MGINKPRFDAWNYHFYALFLMVLPYLESLLSEQQVARTGSRSKNESPRSTRVPGPRSGSIDPGSRNASSIPNPATMV
jgi:hypothetical protein